MASLRNDQIDMEIGITPIGAFKQPALYIKEGNQKRVLAQFFFEGQGKAVYGYTETMGRSRRE